MGGWVGLLVYDTDAYRDDWRALGSAYEFNILVQTESKSHCHHPGTSAYSAIDRVWLGRILRQKVPYIR